MALNINANKSNTYQVNRRDYYEKIVEQLDNLFHDIDNGKFGDTAKTGDFYLNRKAVKDKYPSS